MSFAIVIECPLHPAYNAKRQPDHACKACRLLFTVRNNTNKVLSVPYTERTDLNEIIISEIVD